MKGASEKAGSWPMADPTAHIVEVLSLILAEEFALVGNRVIDEL